MCLKMDATMWILVCSVFTAVLLEPVTTVCPYKNCMCVKGVNVLCWALDGIPALASENKDGSITGLTFAHSKLNSINGSSLPANLQSLLFYNVTISSISSDAFSSSADTLKSFSMWEVNFPELPDALLKVNNLTALKLSAAAIKTWTPGVLQHLGQTLRSVVFENVGLTSWPEWLKDFTLLNSATLSRNKVRHITVDAFSKIRHLTNLSLAKTGLEDEKETNAALRPLMGTLQLLDISYNLFRVIPQAIAGMSKLSKLDISSNLIKEVTSDRIPSQLTELDLSGNYELSELHDNSFPNTSSLDVLTLSWTGLISISNWTFQPLKHLRVLRLDGTKLSAIPSALTKLNSLEILSMWDFNCPCVLDAQLVNWFQSHKSLKVSGNCNNNDLIVENYLTNTTGNLTCSGYVRVTSSVFLHLLLVVVMGVLL